MLNNAEKRGYSIESVPFDMLEKASTEEQLIQLQGIVNAEGHSCFYRLLHGFTAKIKSFTDLQSVPPEERDGEWQIVMDNPATIQEVVCYPALTFLEAVYLFAYFRPQMEKNEYLRLQKVQTLFMQLGTDAD